MHCWMQQVQSCKVIVQCCLCAAAEGTMQSLILLCWSKLFTELCFTPVSWYLCKLASAWQAMPANLYCTYPRTPESPHKKRVRGRNLDYKTVDLLLLLNQEPNTTNWGQKSKKWLRYGLLLHLVQIVLQVIIKLSCILDFGTCTRMKWFLYGVTAHLSKPLPSYHVAGIMCAFLTLHSEARLSQRLYCSNFTAMLHVPCYGPKVFLETILRRHGLHEFFKRHQTLQLLLILSFREQCASTQCMWGSPDA